MNSKCRKWRRIPLFANGERIAIFGVSLNPVFVPVGAVFVPKCAKVVPKFVILCQFVPSCVTRLWENHSFCQKYLTFSLFFRVTHQKSVSRYRILCHGMPVPCHHKIFCVIMSFDNKTLLILGLVFGGALSLYLNQVELACTIFGGLVGYLSKDTLTVKHEEVVSEDGSDSETA